MSSSVTGLLIGLVVLGYILFRQLQPNPVRTKLTLPLVLAIVGVFELTGYLKQHGHAHNATIFAALAGSLVLAIVFAVIRALTVRIWLKDGQPWRQGNWLTALLWIASLGVHLGYDYLVDGKSGSRAGLGNASLTLYFAVTYTVQRLIIQARANTLSPGGSRPQVRMGRSAD